jgi:hypothetical protein
MGLGADAAALHPVESFTRLPAIICNGPLAVNIHLCRHAERTIKVGKNTGFSLTRTCVKPACLWWTS